MKAWEGYKRGVNLGGWYSQCNYKKETYDHFIEKEDFAVIKSWGLDHVRVPVDYNLVEDEQGNYMEEGFAYIQKAIDYCGEYGLNMILDLHKTAGYSFYSGEGEVGLFDNEACQERFYRLWEEFARRFSKFENRLAFELLNEITDRSYSDKWNEIANRCIERIRAIAPTITILVGSYWNNSIEAVKDLWKPHDEHIVYNFHCYEPLMFTHQGAGWIPVMPHDFRFAFDHTYREYYDATKKIFAEQGDSLKDIGTPDEALGAAYFKFFFAQAVAIAEERNVSLYCGEYGVIDYVPNDDMLKWYGAIHEAFEFYGIGRAAWSYRRMNFGLSDERLDGVRDTLVKLL